MTLTVEPILGVSVLTVPAIVVPCCPAILVKIHWTLPFGTLWKQDVLLSKDRDSSWVVGKT